LMRLSGMIWPMIWVWLKRRSSDTGGYSSLCGSV
jgi:hypothetical protein